MGETRGRQTFHSLSRPARWAMRQACQGPLSYPRVRQGDDQHPPKHHYPRHTCTDGLEREGVAYIVVEFINANTLKLIIARNQLTVEQQQEIARRLAGYVRQIRGISLANWEVHTVTYIFNHPLGRIILSCQLPHFVPCEYWVERSGLNRGSDDLSSHPPVLAHGDPTCRNILIESDSPRILAIVDWDKLPLDGILTVGRP
jgi:aminoglycoside phosphotransferase (APT) family kinase protein